MGTMDSKSKWTQIFFLLSILISIGVFTTSRLSFSQSLPSERSLGLSQTQLFEVPLALRSSQPEKKQIEVTPESINILSGVPLTSSEDTTGGFGDVAANYHAALEMKRRLPNTHVRLLVTWYHEPKGSRVRSTLEILKILAPEIDLNLRDLPQKHRGIEIYILSKEADTLHNEGEPAESDRYMESLPKADLAVLYSGNRTRFQKLLSHIGRTWFSFSELSELELPGIETNAWMAHESSAKRGAWHPWLIFPAGIESLGFYYTPSARNENLKRIRFFFQSERLVSRGGPLPTYAFAYTKDQIALENYYRVIATYAFHSNHPVVLIAPDQLHYDTHALPKNLSVLKYSSLPAEVTSALIQEAPIAPLITGDNSLSTYLSRSKPGLFFYSSYPWKHNLAQGLKDAFTPSKEEAQLVSEQSTDWNLIFNFQSRKLSRGEPLQIARWLTDQNLNSLFKRRIQRLQKERDLFESTLFLYSVYRLFTAELRMGLAYFSDFIFELALKTRSFDRLKSELRKSITEPAEGREGLLRKALALMALIRMGEVKPGRFMNESLTQLIGMNDPDVNTVLSHFAYLQPSIRIHLIHTQMATDAELILLNGGINTELKNPKPFCSESFGL